MMEPARSYEKARNDVRVALGFVPLCSFVRHYDADDDRCIESLGDRGYLLQLPAVFCSEPATGIVIHWSYLLGQNHPHDYCAKHGTLISDEIAAALAAGEAA